MISKASPPFTFTFIHCLPSSASKLRRGKRCGSVTANRNIQGWIPATWKGKNHLVWNQVKKRRGGGVEGKETEAEMKQSHGGLSVDRSFRAWSINTNLYWILLLPSSLSSLPLTVIPSLYAGFLPPQATSTLTLRAAGVWGRWMLYPHRGKLLALSISPPRRREKRWGKMEREGKHPSKNQEKEKAVLSAQTTSICCNPTLQMGLQKRISYKAYSGTVNQMLTFICELYTVPI